MTNTNIKNQTNMSITGYSFNLPSAILNNITTTTNKLIANFFSSVQVLASKPIVNIAGNKVNIKVFYYCSDNHKALSSSSINSLGEILSKLFKRPVELHLVRLHYPYLNSYILAQYINVNLAKYSFSFVTSRLFSSGAIFEPITFTDELHSSNNAFTINGRQNIIPVVITGIKVKVSGRLNTQRSVPRQTVQTAQIGKFSSGDPREIVEYSSFTGKNSKGAYTIKVWIGQSKLT